MLLVMFDFIQEYLAYNAGNECPKNYHRWTALVLLAAAAHKQVYLEWGYRLVYPNLYIGLIGDMGSRKSTAKNIGSDIFQTTFPDYPVLASVQSREDIVRFMNSDACSYSYKNEDDAIVEVRPIVGFINELKNFLSFEPGKMIEFLTDIFDSPYFKSSTLARGLEDLKNPCVNFLACETPQWITDKLKGGIISGGWARRIIYVYETEKGPPIARPEKPLGHREMVLRLADHLKLVARTVGKITWSPDAITYWDPWYNETYAKNHDDPLMQGFYSSKPEQVLKVAIGLLLSKSPITLCLTRNLLELAIAWIDVLEPNMAKLSSQAGQNDLAVPMNNMLEALRKAPDQWLPKKTFLRLTSRDLDPMKQQMALKHLIDTEQVVDRLVEDEVLGPDGKKVRRQMIMTIDRYREWEAAWKAKK